MASASFVPSEIRPPPSIMHSDDEDSFEVLRKSMSIDMESLLSEKSDPVENRILKNAQQLLEDAQNSSLTNSTTSISNKKNPSFLIGESARVPAPSAMSRCSSHEEVQQHIEAILEENERLKRSISQSNENMRKMKDQLSQVADWQQEVQKVYQSHKLKFAEAKLYIDNLKLENSKLKSDNGKLHTEAEKYKAIKEITESEMLSLKQHLKLEDTSSQNEKAEDVAEYVSKIKNLEDALQRLNLDHFMIKEENQKLKNATGGNQSADFSSKMVDALEAKIKEKEGFVQTYQLENTLLMEKNMDYVEELETLRNQISQAEQREKSLSEEVATLKKELEEAKVNPEQLAQLKQQLMVSQMKITALEQELSDNKVLLETKQREMDEAESKTKEWEAQKDEIFALNAQLELYKNDYEAEKNNALQIQQIRDQVVNELQNVQRRNGQLQEEIELMRERGFVLHGRYTDRNPGSGTVPRPQSHASPSAPRENNTFSCPKCNFGFRDYQALENHVHRCLELDDVLP